MTDEYSKELRRSDRRSEHGTSFDPVEEQVALEVADRATGDELMLRRPVERSLGINEPTSATVHHHHGPFWHTHDGIIGAGQHEHDGEVAVVFAEMFPWGQVADPCGDALTAPDQETP